MADLSPAAQAVYDAVLATYHESVPRDDSLWALERASTCAALRAAVKHLTFNDSLAGAVINPLELLDIATELESQ